MAERRRRKLVKTSDDSEDCSDVSETEHSVSKESEFEVEKQGGAESEYESAEEEEDDTAEGVKKDTLKTTTMEDEIKPPAVEIEPVKTTLENSETLDTKVENSEKEKIEVKSDLKDASISVPIQIKEKIDVKSDSKEASISVPTQIKEKIEVKSDLKEASISVPTLNNEKIEVNLDLKEGSIPTQIIDTPQISITPAEANVENVNTPMREDNQNDVTLEDAKSEDGSSTINESNYESCLDNTIRDSTIEQLAESIDNLDISVEIEIPEAVTLTSSPKPPIENVQPAEDEKDLTQLQTETTIVDALAETSIESGEIVDESYTNNDFNEELIDEEGGMEDTAEAECEFLEDEDGELEEGELDDSEVVGEENGEYVEGERQQGDGEESVSPTPSKEKVLDDDEDRRNPQYIPKKGSFYEHDNRMMSDPEEVPEEDEKEEEDEKPEDKKKKKLWLEDGRWSHDMFHEDEQIPKSRDELLTNYGYDIRSETGPPRARRRRRYGRGPNKYTRNWQDEDAYFRQGGGNEDMGSSENLPEEDDPPPTREHRRGGRGQRRGRGHRGGGNNFRGQNNNNYLAEEDEGRLDSRRSNYHDNNNSEIDKNDFPALPANVSNGNNREVEPSINVSSGVRGSKPPFSSFSEKEEEPSVVKTLLFQNSRFTGRNNEQDEEEEDQEEIKMVEKVVEMPQHRPIRGRGRGNNRYQHQEISDEPNESGLNWQQQLQLQRSQQMGNDSRQYGGRGKNIHQHRENRYRENYPPRPLSREEELERKLESLALDQQHSRNSSRNEPPPRHSIQAKVGADGRSKRYSSLRQRGGPENSGAAPYQQQQQQPPPIPHQQNQGRGYYKNNGNNYQGAPMYAERQNSQSGLNQPRVMNPLMPGASIYQTYTAVPGYQESFAMRAMPAGPRMFPAPNMGPIPGQTVALAPSYITPPQPPNPNMLNYGPGGAPQALAPAMPQYPYQQYAGPHPPPTSQQAQQELYKGGVTYYNTHSQQLHVGRMPPQRRPKAAIPIVAPTQEQLHMEQYNAEMGGSNDELEDAMLVSSNRVSVGT